MSFRGTKKRRKEHKMTGEIINQLVRAKTWRKLGRTKLYNLEHAWFVAGTQAESFAATMLSIPEERAKMVDFLRKPLNDRVTAFARKIDGRIISNITADEKNKFICLANLVTKKIIY